MRGAHRGGARGAEAPQALHAELAARAPEAAAAIDPRDAQPGGARAGAGRDGREPAPGGADSRLWTARLRHPTLLFGLVMEREALYERIESRVDEIAAGGAADEARRAGRPARRARRAAALGFEELLSGDIEGMKRRTRNYAKRQLTLDATAARCASRSSSAAASPMPAAERIAHILAAQPGEAQV